jgi:hypothetical protein
MTTKIHCRVRLISTPPKGFVYLASPYTASRRRTLVGRFNAACSITIELIHRGVIVFSPIVHGHSIALLGIPTGIEFWWEYDKAFLNRCSVLCVLMLRGWKSSRGIKREIEYARRIGKPIIYLNQSVKKFASVVRKLKLVGDVVIGEKEV